MSWEVRQGDCVELMRAMPAASVDAVVTDPPAGIGFMGRTWDHHRGGMNPWVEWMADVLREAQRVCKPGAHALVWSLPRTSHWTGSALEMAGWEVRDCVTHLFGSGFPKSHNLPNGFGTALKPAAEFWWLARKPLSGTVAQTVLEHGTGALNISGCRVGDDPGWSYPNGAGGNTFHGQERRTDPEVSSGGRWPANVALSHTEGCVQVGVRKVKPGNGSGRASSKSRGFQSEYVGGEAKDVGLPESGFVNPDGTETVGAWSCTPDCPVRLLDEQTGELKTDWARPTSPGLTGEVYGKGDGKGYPGGYVGEQPSGASRFFYVAKSSRAERNAGLEGFVGCTCETFTEWVNEDQPEATPAEPGTPRPRATTGSGTPNSSGSDSPTTSSGNEPTDSSPTVSKSTIATRTSRTTGSKTSSSSPPSSTSESTPPTSAEPATDGSGGATSAVSGNPPTPITGISAETAGSFMADADPATSGSSSEPSSSAGKPCPDCGGVIGGGRRNVHPLEPTVKPIELMRWLVRLVTPPNGTVLDPFTGSGATGCACALEGFDFVGLEREQEYVDIARARIAWWHKHRGDGEAAAVLAAGAERDAVEATGQLGMFEDIR